VAELPEERRLSHFCFEGRSIRQMKKDIHELQKIARDLLREREKMAREVREGGKQAQGGFERVLRAAHRMHALLFHIPEKLMKIVEDLEP